MARILVVEDDEWSRRIVVDLLEMRGHEVIVASDAAGARSQLAAVPALVLLDIHIPGGGGEAVLAEIRATPQLAGLPVIALTASAMAGDRERFLRQGFTAYMSKPINVKLFGPTIESYLEPAP
jgi:CheY-like chemotaxis protein